MVLNEVTQSGQTLLPGCRLCLFRSQVAFTAAVKFAAVSDGAPLAGRAIGAACCDSLGGLLLAVSTDDHDGQPVPLSCTWCSFGWWNRRNFMRWRTVPVQWPHCALHHHSCKERHDVDEVAG